MKARCSLLFVFFAASVRAEDTVDPEALYLRMVQKLLKAKTVQVKGTLEVDSRNEWRATLRLDKAPNRVRYERGRPQEAPLPDGPIRLISDGSWVRSFGYRGPAKEIVRPDIRFGTFAVRAFSGAGMLMGIERGPWTEDTYAETEPIYERFKLLRRERIGTRQTTVVQFVRPLDCGIPGSGEPITIWIDERTGLPARLSRFLSGRCGDQIPLVETYDDITLDLEMPADRFKLPE